MSNDSKATVKESLTARNGDALPSLGAASGSGSDTPRTDEECRIYPMRSSDHFGYEMVRATHARALERENVRLTRAIQAVIERPDYTNPEGMVRRLRGILPNVKDSHEPKK